MANEQLLDDEQIKANRTSKKLEEIELLREAENHYEIQLQTGRFSMLLISFFYLKNLSAYTYTISSKAFFTALILGLFYLIGAYLVKYEPRKGLIAGLLVYFILLVISFLTTKNTPHGILVAFVFIFFVGQSLTVAQKLIIVRQRLSENGEIPRYKKVWY